MPFCLIALSYADSIFNLFSCVGLSAYLIADSKTSHKLFISFSPLSSAKLKKAALRLLTNGIPSKLGGTSFLRLNCFASSSKIRLRLSSVIPLLNNPKIVKGSISNISPLLSILGNFISISS